MKRRNFLTGFVASTAAGALSPSLLMANDFAVTKKIDIRNLDKGAFPDLNFDVVVVGAGPGGIPAARRAAQNGARVVLIEDDMMVGGAPVDMFVTSMFGGPRLGMAAELVKELQVKNDLYNYQSGTEPKGWRFHLPSAYAQLLMRSIRSEKNITLLCGTPVVGVLVSAKGNRQQIKGVRIFRGGSFQDVYARVTIDATGTGIVAAMAGCDCMYGSEAKKDFNEPYGYDQASDVVQPCTQMFISERIRKDAIFPVGFKGSAAEDGYIGANRLSREELERRATGIFFHWGQTIHVKDTRDPVQIAEAQGDCFEKYKSHFAQLHDAGFAVHIAPKLGVRECRRVRGEYVITANDVLHGNMPEDMVALAKYNMDCWGLKGMIDVPTRLYGIPYRSLIPFQTEGLLTAGRVISGTRLAHSSYRVQAICSNIGEAAGTAAAMVAVNNIAVRDIDVRELADKLDGYGLLTTENN
ncbi:MAG: FAD-dependent oxidoreductase [Mangrovibacterium sp.]